MFPEYCSWSWNPYCQQLTPLENEGRHEALIAEVKGRKPVCSARRGLALKNQLARRAKRFSFGLVARGG